MSPRPGQHLFGRGVAGVHHHHHGRDQLGQSSGGNVVCLENWNF